MNTAAGVSVDYAEAVTTPDTKAGASVSVQPLRKTTVKTDAQLVRAARAGQRAAFDELVGRYHRRATSVAYRLVGNVHDALEVCQEAYLRAFRHVRRLKDPARFGAWLLRIVTNVSLNQRRRRGWQRAKEEHLSTRGEMIEDELPGRAPAAEFPGARLAAQDLARCIQAGLAALPEPQRAALILFSVEALPQKRVAKILGCSVEAVKWHVFQARRKLRLRLADQLQATR